MISLRSALTGTLASLAFVAVPLAAQETPLSNFVLAGYGSALYGAGLDGFDSDFAASISPVLLYSLGDDILFEAELEFGLEGTGTQTVLEYAQLDYLGFDRAQLTIGKFLLPFGVFGERLHPSWINKFPTMPLLYGHAHGGQAPDALFPVLSDLGFMARYSQPLGGLDLDLSFYVTQGPMRVDTAALEPDGHAHSVRDPSLSVVEGQANDVAAAATTAAAAYQEVIPDVAFGVSVPDNNRNKLIGVRLGLVKGPTFEVFLSGFHSMYDPDDYLDLVGGNLAFEFRTTRSELRTEVAYLAQEFSDNGVYRYFNTPGYYGQYAYRLGAVEPVVRWSHLLPGTVEGADVTLERQELALGVNYWVLPSVPVKLAYAYDPDREDRLIFQWAFGF